MSSSIWTLDYSEVFRDLSPLALLVTIIGIAIFMINMFYTKNANREREAPARLCDERIMFDYVSGLHSLHGCQYSLRL